MTRIGLWCRSNYEFEIAFIQVKFSKDDQFLSFEKQSKTEQSTKSQQRELWKKKYGTSGPNQWFAPYTTEQAIECSS